MEKKGLSEFSNGVFAIIITIMVLELKAPESGDIKALLHLLPIFLSYLLSYIYVAIYWSNHHHLMGTVNKVNGKLLWANTGLLFFLSLIPFTTAWIGENYLAPWPTAIYGLGLLCSSIAYYVLERVIIATHGSDSLLEKAVGQDKKAMASPFLYVIGMSLAFVNPVLSILVYGGVALMWLVPDKRIERVIPD